MNLDAKMKHYRISAGEYERIQSQLGRPPEGVEWALYSALWNEHCSYKSSRVHLKNLFNTSPRVLMSFGENAGVIDLGEGEKIAFKMESHNHPSYIEPYQGAATGVGGILRDIFTMGARPIAVADYLCFGEPTAPKMTALVDGVVRGIGGYGNCVGVPNITGQTEFHKSYNKNILVNALALGYFAPGEPVVTAKASGIGNLVVYVGAKTGKDGVHGASMASESFDENSEAKKPTIQKGDPFLEKLLIESCIEVMHKNLVVAIQDMGAAGLTSSSFEMAARGQVGFRVHLDRVPLRDSSMTPEEILLSESQERMLMIVKPENLEPLRKVFARWDLDAEAIGEVTKGPEVELFWHAECICRMNPALLVDEAPRYERPYTKWQPKNRVLDFKPLEAGVKSKNEVLLKALAHPQLTSRNWIYDQYDQRVGAKTAYDCSENIGVVRLPSSGRALGLVLGARPHVMRFDAAVGATDSIAYPGLQLAAKGFETLAATDCLNFGNPENIEIMSEFVATIENMSAQCAALNAPIISGNVSFYNETLGENITSTPATGLVGLRSSVENLPSSKFTTRNDEIYILRCPQLIAQGVYAEIEGRPNVGQGELEPQALAGFTEVVRSLSGVDGVNSTRVVGKMGLAYALARMSNENLGADVCLADTSRGLFTETLYEVIFAVSSDSSFQFREKFAALTQEMVKSVSEGAAPISLENIGTVKPERLKIGTEIDLALTEISKAYTTNWEVLFAGLS